ncbi:MAG: hypothetical protein K9N49_09510 [Candidatus Marinimicrobia bacterium]|nr:hypothetical protein [Candidatus Neomarinimicrobiota bacterium]
MKIGLRLISAGIVTGLLLGLPLIGVRVQGQPLSQYTEFPPLTRYVEHAGFSRPIFALFALVTLALLIPLLIWFAGAIRRRPLRPPAAPFPLWGWAGIALLLGGWILAWTRFPWAAAIQPFTFSPPWFGYILVVQALTFRRNGTCRLTSQPARFLLLFPVSAAFWWYFEYLNRFVQNWYYVGIGDLSPTGYFWLATLAFSTVLPAVLGTYDLLTAWLGLAAAPPRPPRRIPRWFPVGLLALSAAGLAGLAVWPNLLFPLLWLAPLLLLSAARLLAGRPPLDPEPGETLWPRIARLAAAALICGFFWEMWNYYSLARWVYAVPYVDRFQLFEMPLLGYAGYLPFGIECALIGDLVSRRFNGTARHSNRQGTTQ